MRERAESTGVPRVGPSAPPSLRLALARTLVRRHEARVTGSMQAWTGAMRARRYDEAWAMEAAAIAARDPATRDDPALPYHRRWVWDGTPVDGRDVLVRCYHGLGDTIQYARYLPVLAARARSVTVEVQPSLVPIVGHLAERVRPFDVAAPLPPADCDVGITELPCVLRVPPEEIGGPYIFTTPAVLPRGTIGLCPTAGDWDTDRSIPEQLLAPLCGDRPSVMLAAEATGLPCLNPDGCPRDMAATASLVAGCDLVVTVDTMVAHLAGALGRPTWLLLKAEPDWRWCPASRRSAWYPTMRLYAQPSPGDWPGALTAIAADLRGMPCLD